MAHDVLISYSSHDQPQADAICNRLEARGIRCWIAPRDVGLGEYAESIVEAIEEAKVMVLVFSANADRSTQVKRELERAVSKGTTIVPVRIEDAEMSKSLEFYVSSMHWLDAITPPLEEHIDRLAKQLQGLLAEGGDGAGAGAAARQATAIPPPAVSPRNDGWKKIVGVVAGLAVLALIAMFALRPASVSNGSEAVEEPAPEPATTAPTDTSQPEPTSPPPVVDPTVEMRFTNATGAATAVYWVDSEGTERKYETLDPGQTWVAETYAGHEWAMRLVGGTRRFPLVSCRAPEDDPCRAVNGLEVSYAGFVDGSGEPLGAYVQTAGSRWVEKGPDGNVRFQFEEQTRDEWSVYLTDASRGANIQIDLWTGKIRYSDANNPAYDLYDIESATG